MCVLIFQVLSDEDKRKQYDRCGEDCVKDGVGQHDPFSDFFGGFGGFGFGFGGGRQNPETPRGDDVLLNIFVTLEELYSGNFVEVTVFETTAWEMKVRESFFQIKSTLFFTKFTIVN